MFREHKTQHGEINGHERHQRIEAEKSYAKITLKEASRPKQTGLLASLPRLTMYGACSKEEKKKAQDTQMWGEMSEGSATWRSGGLSFSS